MKMLSAGRVLGFFQKKEEKKKKKKEKNPGNERSLLFRNTV
jgi:hypothetical protein